MAVDQRLVDLEVPAQVIDLYNAEVFLFDHPAMGENDDRRQHKEQEHEGSNHRRNHSGMRLFNRHVTNADEYDLPFGDSDETGFAVCKIRATSWK